MKTFIETLKVGINLVGRSEKSQLRFQKTGRISGYVADLGNGIIARLLITY